MKTTQISKRLQTIMKILSKYNLKIELEEVVNFNETRRPQSGFDAGYKLLKHTDANRREMQILGDAIIDISFHFSKINYL
jgi:hypothetical protein